MPEAASRPSYKSKILQQSLEKPTGCLVFSDGTVVYGQGFGAEGETVAELCFNTAMTGYQEIMSDPSYKGQIVTFTFPHVGNVGQNADDLEHTIPHAEGIVVHAKPTEPSSWRSEGDLTEWMEKHGRIGISHVDTRSITRMTGRMGALHVAMAHSKTGDFDIDALKHKAASFAGLKGLDLATDVSTHKKTDWSEPRWRVEQKPSTHKPIKVVAIDYGAKHNILRCLSSAGCDSVIVLPATSTAEEVLAHKPDGVFLSNGPGDPAATAEYTVPVIQHIINKTDLPLFGICLGHQLLALAMGAKTVKMSHGHHGANHPVKNHATGQVEITSMNHGFSVDVATLPDTVEETHISLFDGTNCGLKLKNRPIFSVQYHPEASPGPQDSLYLFEQFVSSMHERSASFAPAS